MAKPTIVCVDDERIILTSLREQLQRSIGNKVKIELAESAEEAIEIISELQEENVEIPVLISDQIMPGMKGDELLIQVHQSYPHILKILLTGQANNEAIVNAVNCANLYRFIAKPWDEIDISLTVKGAIDKYFSQKKIAMQSIVLKKINQDLEIRINDRTKELAQSLEQLAQANVEISLLNQRLSNENLQMSAQLSMLQHIQKIILPKTKELQNLQDLDIAAIMEPADNLAGDYFDVFTTHDRLRIAIGDVTGHGLESGVLMIMLQAAVRSLSYVYGQDYINFFKHLNQTIYENVYRLGTDKSISFCVLDYAAGEIFFSGQHENIILVKHNGEISVYDTSNLGFPLGLIDTIEDFIGFRHFILEPGDTILLFTDGVTEAINRRKEMYGIDRMCTIIKNLHQCSAQKILEGLITDVKSHITNSPIDDDLTLVVCKKRQSDLPPVKIQLVREL